MVTVTRFRSKQYGTWGGVHETLKSRNWLLGNITGTMIRALIAFIRKKILWTFFNLIFTYMIS